ncbi:MAG: MFS-type bicyclomycin resistance protein [Rickettsiaceae bacterium]|jgi:Bcr/CflA subfamily drug resistance transporter|nr:MFS-type bicyclomycin resistance protein [Rickettsiaceae bacterium]
MKVIAKVPIWLLIILFGLSHTSETVISIALPSLAHHLSVTDNMVQLSSSIYFFSFAMGIFFWGRVSDIFGRRPIMLTGLCIYFIATINCLNVNSIEALLALRFLQAFGASVASVICQAMTRDSYQGHELANAFASVSIGMSMVPSIGPVFGGYLVEFFGWKYNFIFLSTVSSLIFILCLFKLPETNPNLGLPITTRYSSILISVLTDRKALFFAMTVGFFNGMMFGFYTTAPFIFIKMLGIHPSTFGKFGFVLSVSVFFGGYLNRILIRKYIDSHRIILAGMRISLIGCSILFIFGLCRIESRLPIFISSILIMLCMVTQLLGHALVVPTSLKLALEDYTKTTGTAGSIFGGMYYAIVATVSFTISRIHGSTILPFTSLYFLLSLTCFLSFTVYYRNKRAQDALRAT